MLVVSDASPINILVRIGHIDILPGLYGAVVVPPSVYAEMSHEGTPDLVRQWIRSAPSWLGVRKPSIELPAEVPGRGEREAIGLALELKADLILMDDLKARMAAVAAGLAVTGTLGVLERAAATGLVDFRRAVQALRQTDFRIADELVERALVRDTELRERRERNEGR